MKKLINTALVYLIAGAIAGVFFREFTRFMDYNGASSLGLVHGHLIALGLFVFLIATLFSLYDNFTQDKLFKPFYIVYNLGMIITAGMMLVRGITEVSGTLLPLPDAALSGIAGLGHMMLGVGLVLLVIMFKGIVNRKIASAKSVA